MLKTLSTHELKILRILEENSRITPAEIAAETEIAEDIIKEIIEQFEKEEIILKYRAIVNWEKIESPEVTALIQVNVTPQQGKGYNEVARKISDMEEVQTCILVSGAFDLLIEVSGPSLKEVSFFVAEKLATIDGIEHTRTNFLLKRYKQAGDVFTTSVKTHRLPMII